MLGLIITPLVASLVLRLFSKLFKFPKNDFKTALYCIVITLGVFVGVSFIPNMLFLGQKLSPIFTIFSFVISLVVGTYVVYRFYGSSLLKSFFALLLTGLTLLIALFFVILIIDLSIAFIK
jgi:hypothetical protein